MRLRQLFLCLNARKKCPDNSAFLHIRRQSCYCIKNKRDGCPHFSRVLRQVIVRRSPPKGLICHTDRGSQYAGNDFKTVLAQREFIGSMSKKGDCWDNAVAESFFHALKVELIHRMKFRTRETPILRARSLLFLAWLDSIIRALRTLRDEVSRGKWQE